MSLPPNTAMVLSHGDWDLPGDHGKECEGAAFHSPRPLFVVSTGLVLPDWYQPRIIRDAPWVGGPHADLCGTCRDNVYILLQMLHETDGALEWGVRREFGNGIRALALKGWKYFAEHRPAQPAAAAPKG